MEYTKTGNLFIFNSNADMVKYFFRKLFLFTIPFLCLVIFYCFMDPFKVIWHYDNYFDTSKPHFISLNKDFVSTENWLNRYKDHKYDSYIFGNSRSIYYEVNTWKDYIGTDVNKCYHFDASGESIFGIANKFNFLSKQKAPIKNALIIFDSELLNQANNSAGHLFLKHPNISGEKKISFQIENLKAFLDYKFLVAFIDFKLSGKVKEYMKKQFLLNDKPFQYDPVNNEMQQRNYEELIKTNPDEFYGPRQSIFYNRQPVQKYSKKVIGEKQLELLDNIKRVLNENKTNYHIVISPLYDQIKMNPADLQVLQSIFGSDKVFDFSGINEFTNDKQNYYETSHYRPHIAANIMKKIYGEKAKQIASFP